MGSGASRGQKPLVYMFPLSPPSRAVLLVAKTIGVEVDTKSIDLMKGEQNEEEYLKINPDHTVPTLNDNGFILWESRAIMSYLVDTYKSGHHLYPRDLKMRAKIDRLLYQDTSFVFRHVFAFMGPQIMKKAADPEKQKEVEKVMEYLEDTFKRLQGDDVQYIVGTDKPTLADVSIMASLSLLELNNWDFSRWPKIEAWRQKMLQMPHYEEINKAVQEFKEQMSQ